MLSLAVPHVAFSAPVVDVGMAPTYDRLATKVLDGISSRGPDSAPHWIAIGGGPGSGKSTLADAVAARVNAALGLAQPPACVVLPMDGFHYSRAQLRALDPPDASEFLPRRGAPWTFDADDCFAQFSAAKRAGEAAACADGRFVHVFVDRHSRRAVPIPEPVRAALARLTTPAPDADASESGT